MVWAVIPVKRLEKVKQRLGKELSLINRKHLCLAMLYDVIDKLSQATMIDRIAVVTSDIQVKTIVRFYNHHVHMIKESGRPSLNGALHQAAQYLQKHRVTHMFIVLGDLPLIKVEEINQVIAQSKDVAVTIIPDKTWHGTNGLLLSPPNVIPPCFGPNSFWIHLEQAKSKGVPYRIYPLTSLSRDVDYLTDLSSILDQGVGTKTYQEIFHQGLYHSLISNLGRTKIMPNPL